MKRKQILLPEIVIEEGIRIAKSEERSFSNLARRALEMLFEVRQKRLGGWTIYLEKDGERERVNW